LAVGGQIAAYFAWGLADHAVQYDGSGRGLVEPHLLPRPDTEALPIDGEILAALLHRHVVAGLVDGAGARRHLSALGQGERTTAESECQHSTKMSHGKPWTLGAWTGGSVTLHAALPVNKNRTAGDREKSPI